MELVDQKSDGQIKAGLRRKMIVGLKEKTILKEMQN